MWYRADNSNFEFNSSKGLFMTSCGRSTSKYTWRLRNFFGFLYSLPFLPEVDFLKTLQDILGKCFKIPNVPVFQTCRKWHALNLNVSGTFGSTEMSWNVWLNVPNVQANIPVVNYFGWFLKPKCLSQMFRLPARFAAGTFLRNQLLFTYRDRGEGEHQKKTQKLLRTSYVHAPPI